MTQFDRLLVTCLRAIPKLIALTSLHLRFKRQEWFFLVLMVALFISGIGHVIQHGIQNTPVLGALYLLVAPWTIVTWFKKEIL